MNFIQFELQLNALLKHSTELNISIFSKITFVSNKIQFNHQFFDKFIVLILIKRWQENN